jgi:hypothetical protein
MKQHKWHEEETICITNNLIRHPLAPEQVRSLFNQRIVEHGFHVSWGEFSKIVKDVEQAHGIGKDK